jgi:hypothetical protein
MEPAKAKVTIRRMPEAKLVVAKTFGSRMEVDMARGAVEGAGIDCMIQTDSAGGMQHHLAWTGSGFKLLVREHDVELARQVLEHTGPMLMS